MKCDECLSLIESMLDGELSVESTALANNHADTCKTCRVQKDCLTTLHERMGILIDNIEVPPTLEQEIRAALANEAKRNRRPSVLEFGERFSRPKILIAAAVASLLIAGIYAYSSKPNLKIAQQSTVKDNPANSVNVLTISADDLVAHTQSHVVSNFHYSPSQLPTLNKQSGFDIKPPVIAGWRLGDICICSMGADGQPVVHMTYVSNRSTTQKKNRAPRILTCYQLLGKHFDERGMSKDEISQRPIWYLESHKLAVALVKNADIQTVFVATLPVKQITSIAEHS